MFYPHLKVPVVKTLPQNKIQKWNDELVPRGSIKWLVVVATWCLCLSLYTSCIYHGFTRKEWRSTVHPITANYTKTILPIVTWGPEYVFPDLAIIRQYKKKPKRESHLSDFVKTRDQRPHRPPLPSLHPTPSPLPCKEQNMANLKYSTTAEFHIYKSLAF